LIVSAGWERLSGFSQPAIFSGGFMWIDFVLLGAAALAVAAIVIVLIFVADGGLPKW